MPQSKQLLVVTSPDWHAPAGTLRRFWRSDVSAPWECVSPPIPVSVGKHGMGWGRGKLDFCCEEGLHKQEGDGKSPAGFFALGPVFGDLSHQPHVKNMPFLPITDDLECVDDPNSAHYNQFVHANMLPNRDWKSSEKMREMGPVYALGIVVQHNLNPVEAGMGSAIFMHCWSQSGLGTAGCTTMALDHLRELVAWVDVQHDPHLVQMPLSEYNKNKAQYGWPGLHAGSS